MTRLLQPFWDRLGAMQAEHDWMTDANFLAALFEVPDSVLARMLLDDRRDLAAVRLAIMDVVEANRVPGVGGGMSEAARRVIEAMGAEQEAHEGDVQRQEYVLLGLLREGVPQVRALLATFGIDRERVLRELPAEVREAGAVTATPALPPQAGGRGGLQGGGGSGSILPALAHSSAIRLMDFVYERKRQGHAPRPEFILSELTQLPYSPVPRIAMAGGFRSDDIGERIHEATLTARQEAFRDERDWTPEADRVMATAFGLWRGRGELTLDHFLLALLEVGGERVVAVLASLGVTAERVHAGMPRLGADM